VKFKERKNSFPCDPHKLPERVKNEDAKLHNLNLNGNQLSLKAVYGDPGAGWAAKIATGKIEAGTKGCKVARITSQFRLPADSKQCPSC
jgi:hypothetical protein